MSELETGMNAAGMMAEVPAAAAGMMAEAPAAAAGMMAEAPAGAAGMMAEAPTAAAPETAAFENVQASDPISGTGTFTETERKQIEDFAGQIDLNDTKMIINYGGGVQKQMADFSESVLQNVRTHDLGEVGSMLTGVITDLKNFNPGEEAKGGLFGLFKKQGKKLEEIKAGYDKAAVNVDKVAQALQQHQITLLKDVDMLDRMYASNLKYYKQLSMYIAAGKKKIADVREKDLAAAKLKAAQSGLAEDAQAAKDLEDQLIRFEKKIYDLELTRAVALQTAPQIRMIQNNDTIMVEKIQSTIVNTIPLWKNQMVLALGLNDSLQAAKAENEVTNMTNQLLMQNAAKLKQTTIETAKASERGIVDIETLKKTNQSLITTLDEVAKIQTEGRTKRAQAENDLQSMEDELKRKLLSMQPDTGMHQAAVSTPPSLMEEEPPRMETFEPFAKDNAPWMQ